MPFSFYKTRRLRYIFIVYWFLLLYIIAALVFWFIALNKQNRQMAAFEISKIKPADPQYDKLVASVKNLERRKIAQYIGEGSTFLLVILAGAVFVHRAVLRQFKAARQQQNFMMAITHELKTPIAITKLNLETLQKRKLAEDQQQRLIFNTIQETDRLNALCNNMLLASQMEAGRHILTIEDVDLTQLVTGCINDFIIRFPQRNIIQSIGQDIFINGDVLMLQIAVNNLIDNAIKYSSKASPISVLLEQANNQVSLSIVDEGGGIEAAEKTRIFEKFYRLGNTATKGAKGTGLGLFLTKKIVQQHHARITVTDNTPAGSNFTIFFKYPGEAVPKDSRRL